MHLRCMQAPVAHQASESFSYLLGKLRAPQPVQAPHPLQSAPSAVAPGAQAAHAAASQAADQIPTPDAPQLAPYSLPAPLLAPGAPKAEPSSAAASACLPQAALLGEPAGQV